MNILIVNNIPFNPSLGGIERVTDILTKELINCGYNISYLFGYIDENQQLMLNYNFPCPIYILPEPGLYKSENNLSFYKSLISKLNINIVINQRGLNTIQNEILIPSVRTISVLHSIPNCYMNYALQNVLSHSNNLKGYIKYIVKLILYPYLYNKIKKEQLIKLVKQYSYISSNSDAVVLLSKKYISEFISHTQVQNTLIKAIPNPNTFSAQKTDFSQKEKIILFVGRLDEIEKNPMRLLKIWKYIYKKHKDWKLVIIGEGNAKTDMLNYIYRNNLKNIIFAGQQKKVENFYKKACFICITSNFEGWGMSLTEGMTFGCIPFTFNCYGAASDIIDDNINGCLIHPYNIKEYAYRLSELMLNEERRYQMALEAQKKVREFDISNIVNKWTALFHSITNNKMNNKHLD